MIYLLSGRSVNSVNIISRTVTFMLFVGHPKPTMHSVTGVCNLPTCQLLRRARMIKEVVIRQRRSWWDGKLQTPISIPYPMTIPAYKQSGYFIAQMIHVVFLYTWVWPFSHCSISGQIRQKKRRGGGVLEEK